MTYTSLKVLRVFLDQHRTNVQHQLAGADVMRLAGISSGTMYPLMHRLEQAGLLEAAWEAEAPAKLGRPQRKLYRLTGAGAEFAANALQTVTPLLVPQES
jgi:PadR family transcriptional regulator PadR